VDAHGQAVTVRNEQERHRYEALAGETHAGSAFHREAPGVIAFTHTEVEDAFAGAGIGSALVRSTLDDARGRGLAVLPFCPLVKGFIARHGDHRALVPAEDRDRFGL